VLLATVLQRFFPEVAAGAREGYAVRVNLAPEHLRVRLHDVRQGIPRAPRRGRGDVMRLIDARAVA
jgi:hypothetical protein